jgi:hypothetical protein
LKKQMSGRVVLLIKSIQSSLWIQLYWKLEWVVRKMAVYIMLTLEGKKEIIGIWIGENKTSKYWLSVLNDIARSARCTYLCNRYS